MKILCDQNMPYAYEAFSRLGQVTLKPGRQIGPDDVRDADLLFTRSTTKVGAGLLEGSHIRFYGSSVIGTDHIDIPYLERRGIPWCSAPGCNAESVANYITAALFSLSGKNGFALAGKTAGVIGVGNVGTRVCRHLSSLGLRVLRNDPPVQRRLADAGDPEAGRYVPLEEILQEADILTLHVPLTNEGHDMTRHLLDAAAFGKMKHGVILMNAARGPVLDTDALLAALENGTVAHAVIDCWEGEPSFRTDLAARADLTTPHIAGHAYEGKVNGTAAVYRSACSFLGVKAEEPFVLPPPPLPSWELDGKDAKTEIDEEALLRPLVLSVYDIEADCHRFQKICGLPERERASSFDKLRSTYPMRRQFDATEVLLKNVSARLGAKLQGLGFKVSQPVS
ncbi:MAG: 4-phosphoerythronate dehydrogenase [Kiritimatiellae bacterium]|nr:4-phosphoerythronate dehydrogenase [Kiritimatiellia bacterium]